jgi:nucleotidyltransferase substrate binding protein (TIGR01987 family)
MAKNLDQFERALNALEKALAEEKNDITRDATIQRFEFSVELAWKSAKRIMGTSTTAPKQVVREMAQNNLINDVEFWLVAIDKRNLSSHTYNEELANEVYNFAKSFLPLAKELFKKLK